MNELAKTYLALQSLPLSQYFQNQFPAVFSAGGKLLEGAYDRLSEPYDMPDAGDVTDFGAAEAYEGGAPASKWMQYVIDQITNTNIPDANLQDVAEAAAGLTVSDSIAGAEAPPSTIRPAVDKAFALDIPEKISSAKAPDTTLEDLDLSALENNPNYQAARTAYSNKIDSTFAKRSEKLENILEINNIANSTYATEQRNDLADQKASAHAMADLQALQVIGGEQRADISTAGNILNNLFTQGLSGAQFDLGAGQAVGATQRANLDTLMSALSSQFGMELAGEEFGLKAGQALGQEDRANMKATFDALYGLFGQNMSRANFARSLSGDLGAAVGQAEGMDVTRRGLEFQRTAAQTADAQRIFTNLLKRLMGSENIAAQRQTAVQNPLSMLLSGISGLNVAPPVLSSLQMPGPGAGEQFANFAGNLISNILPAFIPTPFGKNPTTTTGTPGR
jgi:hypothetical protein